MIYLKADGKWYKTKYASENDITIFAWDYIDIMVDDDKDMIYRVARNEHLPVQAVRLELWLQDTETLPYFNEEKFIKIKTHFEKTGQVVKTDFIL